MDRRLAALGRGAVDHGIGDAQRAVPGARCWPTFGRPMLAWFQVRAPIVASDLGRDVNRQR